jgi:hypothetical protein
MRTFTDMGDMVILILLIFGLSILAFTPLTEMILSLSVLGLSTIFLNFFFRRE